MAQLYDSYPSQELRATKSRVEKSVKLDSNGKTEVWNGATPGLS